MEKVNELCDALFEGKRLSEAQKELALHIIDRCEQTSEISKLLKRKLVNGKLFDEYEAHLFEELFAKEYGESENL